MVSDQLPNTQSDRWPDKPIACAASSESELAEDALAGEQFGAQADHETEHGQAAIPGFSEIDEAEAAFLGVSHGVLVMKWMEEINRRSCNRRAHCRGKAPC